MPLSLRLTCSPIKELAKLVKLQDPHPPRRAMPLPTAVKKTDKKRREEKNKKGNEKGNEKGNDKGREKGQALELAASKRASKRARERAREALAAPELHSDAAELHAAAVRCQPAAHCIRLVSPSSIKKLEV